MYSNWAVTDSKEHLGGQVRVFKTHFSSDDVRFGGCAKFSNAAFCVCMRKITHARVILQFFVEKLDDAV